MAIAKLSAPFEQLSGAVGGQNGVVAMPDKNGRTLLRENVIPNFPATTEQYAINNFFSSVSTAFAQIGDAVKAQWDAAAAGLQETGRLGDPYGVTGQMLYVRVNMYRLMDGQAITSTPPSTLGASGPVSLVPQLDTTNLLINLTWATDPGAGFLYIKMNGTDLTPSRNARQNDLRAITTDQADSIIPISLTGLSQSITFAAQRFPPQINDRRGFGVIQLNSDYFPVNGIFVPNVVIATA